MAVPSSTSHWSNFVHTGISEVPQEDEWAGVTAQMSAGSTDAFHRFYDAYVEAMLKTAQRTTGRDENTCMDIVHDAMLKSMRGMRRIPNRSHLDAFVRVLTQRTALDWLRREMRQQKLRRERAKRVPSQDHEWPAETESEDQARVDWLEMQIASLPSEIRQLFHWRYRMGWSLCQIAGQLGMSIGSIDGKLRRNVAALKARAEQDLNE